MRLVYRWAYSAIRRLDLSQRPLSSGICYNGLALLLILPLLLTGCASSEKLGYNSLSSLQLTDPLEPVNRMVFGFNDGLDRFLIRPVTVVYAHAVPSAVRLSVRNFFSNLQLPATIANDVLQGRFAQGRLDFERLLINSTLGVAGIFDVAGAVGRPPHEEDYGQTLARWRLPSGPYLVLPLLGASNVRDAVALVPAFIYPDPVSYNASGRDLTLGYALRTFNARAELLIADHILKLQLDPYLFVRESYWQQRLAAIYDDLPPAERRAWSLEPLSD
ncbi:MAG TPA: VacJ family lipoprotein [Gammaproteobacteria bacterium]|nr:VacJ family lipoprotein [Gammaproteobacteria bacterium]